MSGKLYYSKLSVRPIDLPEGNTSASSDEAEVAETRRWRRVVTSDNEKKEIFKRLHAFALSKGYASTVCTCIAHTTLYKKVFY